MAILKQLAQEDIGLLVIKQKLAVAAGLSERLMVIVNEQIALETTSIKILGDASAQNAIGVLAR